MPTPPSPPPPFPTATLTKDLWLLGSVVAALAVVGCFTLPLFAILADLACALTGAATFLVVWNARLHVDEDFFLILGLAFLAAAFFDGTRPVLVASQPGLSASAAILAGLRPAGMLLLSLALCFGAWRPQRRRISIALVGVWLGCAAVVLALVFLPWEPLAALRVWEVPGAGPGQQGRPLLEATGNGLAALLFAAAAVGVWSTRTLSPGPIGNLLLASLCCLAISAAICAAGRPGGAISMLGHTFKVLGYCLSCQAIVVIGISRPHALLFREINRREQELTGRMVRLSAQARAIFDLGGVKSLEGGDFKDFAAALLQRATAVIGIGRAGVWVFSPTHDRLVCLLGSGPASQDEGVSLACGAAQDYFEAVAHERVIAAVDVENTLLLRCFLEPYLKPRGIGSLLDAPFRFSGRVAGVLRLEHLGSARHWSDDEQAFAGSMADMLSLALETSERRRASQELAESEQRLRSLLDAMPDPVCFKDAEGRWIVANQALIEDFGLTGISWQGRTDAELAAKSASGGEAFAAAAATDARTWASRAVTIYGISIPTPGGQIRHFDVIKAPLFNADGSPKGLVVLSRDITAYRDALARLRETNAELEAIYNETSDGLVIADATAQTIIRVNAAACRMFGYAPHQFTAIRPGELHPEAERHSAESRFADIAAGNRRLLEAIPCRRQNGETFHADISGQAIAYGGQPAILAFFRDISERRNNEERVRNSEDHFRKVFNSTYDAIFLHNADGTILDVNDKMLELYGVRREEAATFGIEADYSSQDNPKDKLAEYWRDVMAGEERFFEWKARRPHDGSHFFVEVYLRRLSVGQNNVILANVRDVTERKRVQAALAARQEEISALNRDLARRVRVETEKNRQKDILLLNQTRLAAMGEMIGNIAHQWRQPLNALSILLANLRFEYDAVCDDTRALDVAHKQAFEILRKMSSTIDDFRNFFKPDRKREPFLVVDAIGDALLLIEASLAQHGIALHFVARHNPRVEGFRGEFSQVILNLLSNAKDAILAHKPALGCIAIRVMERKGQAAIHISDNGGGLSPEIVDRIFDPYFTTKGSQDGTGLGLYMSRTIITDHMSGSLTVANHKHGARMAIRLPLAPAARGPLHRSDTPGDGS
ncbi:PAS domain S-box protein [Desulfovibrio aerotolerans]|uniref:histidine kinase n=1 Tax=Solidesulfovibrio aerotolerans TaxID=295255 RepID=A0A7C9IMJ4_9BACT|nr:PAS domain S-box protein [Solidesulfovibrio aerotolerans]MYL82499.1 PAS domain S-box protein [Solidesulfovibrio aerotolerans]